MTEFKPADINAAPMCILIKNQILGKKNIEKSSGLKHISPEIQPESQSMILAILIHCMKKNIMNARRIQ